MTTPIRKVLIPLAVILVLVVGALAVVKSQVTKSQGDGAGVAIAPGSVIPDLTLHKFPSGEITLSEQLANSGAKVLLVNFWATWCEACMIEMPSIMSLRNRFKDRGFDVAAVTVDENPGSVVPRVLERLKIDLPVYIDSDQKLSDLFDVHAIPLTVILDKDRKILHVEAGERDWDDDEVRSMVERWLTQ